MLSQRKAGALLSYVNIVVKNLVGIIYTPILLRFLGQNDYGVYQMTYSMVIALSLLSMGFSASYIRFYSIRKANNDEDGIQKLNGMYMTLFVLIALVCCICGAILWANTSVLFHKGLSPAEIGLARVLIIFMVFNLALSFPASVFDSFIMAHEKFIFQQSRQLFTNLAAPIFGVAFLFMGMGAVGVVLAQTIVQVLLFLLNMRYAIAKLGMHFNFRGFEWTTFKAIAIFSFWILLSQIFDLINNSVPNFLLGALASASQVAVFSIALQIRNIFVSLSTSLSAVFVPKINDMVARENDNNKLTALMTKVGRYQLVIFLFILGGFIVVGQYFIRIWAGPNYEPAYWMIIVMTIPLGVPLIQNTGIEIQRAKNRHKMRSLVYLGTALLDLAICVIFIPRFGYLAPTWGYVISMVLGCGIFMNLYYHKGIQLNMIHFWKSMIPPLLCGVISTVLGVAIAVCNPVKELGGFIINGSAFCIIFVLFMYFFVLTQEEKQVIRTKLHR